MIQHECVHGFCHLTFGSTGPTWLSEGIAELGHHWRDGDTAVEKIPEADATADALTAMGHTVKRRETGSGLHGLERREDGLRGAADPRRDGGAVGD